MTNSKDFISGILATMTAGFILTALAKAKPAPPPEKPPEEGEIIPIDTKVYGKCDLNRCLVGEEINIYTTFKNIGEYPKSNKIGIKINDEIKKEEFVELNSYQEYIMHFSMILDEEKTYDICGIIL